MGFLEQAQAKNVQSQKAAAYDKLLSDHKEQSIYGQGLADKEKELMSRLMQTIPNADQNPAMMPPQGVNVTPQEMAEAQSMFGPNVNMQQIDDLRKMKSLEQLQGGLGAPADSPVNGLAAQQVMKGQ